MIPAPSEKLLQVTFRYQGLGKVYPQLVTILARCVANAPGLIWNTWLVDEGAAEAGSIYLFQDGKALAAYLRGPILPNLRHQEGVCDVTIRTFDTLNEISLIASERGREKNRRLLLEKTPCQPGPGELRRVSNRAR